MKSIWKAGYWNDKELIQVLIKDAIEKVIIKEKSSRFQLAYFSTLFEEEFCKACVYSAKKLW